MSRFLKAIQSVGWKVLDPKRDERINAWATEVETALLSNQKGFDLRAVMQGIGIEAEDEHVVVARVYEIVVRRAWAKGMPTEKETKILTWAARALEIDRASAAEAERKVGMEALRDAATKLGRGWITREGIAGLHLIAKAMGYELRTLSRTEFRQESDQLLDCLFGQFLSSAEPMDLAWQVVQGMVGELGRQPEEFCDRIRKTAEGVVQNIESTVRKNGGIDQRSRQIVSILLQHVAISQGVAASVQREIYRAQIIEGVRQGRMPSIPCHDIGMRAGEIVHVMERGEYICVTMRKDGPHQESYAGLLKITDGRLMFMGATSAHEFRHQSVMGLRLTNQGIEVRSNGQEISVYRFGDNPLIFEIYKTAIGRANQTVVDRSGEGMGRHISRDVQQRVWQKYGGRCVECGGEEYLEFDHIVPVAKGGSNSEQNVQLLCRGCNARKSDKI